MSLSGTHHKKEPLWELGSKEVTISVICSFLYILDKSLINQLFLLRWLKPRCIKSAPFIHMQKKKNIYLLVKY